MKKPTIFYECHPAVSAPLCIPAMCLLSGSSVCNTGAGAEGGFAALKAPIQAGCSLWESSSGSCPCPPWGSPLCAERARGCASSACAHPAAPPGSSAHLQHQQGSSPALDPPPPALASPSQLCRRWKGPVIFIEFY